MNSQRRTRTSTSRAAGPTGQPRGQGHGPGARGPGQRPAWGQPRDEDDPLLVATMEEVMAAVNAVDLDGPWPAVATEVMPVLERRRPFPGGAELPLRRTFPPGLAVSFGLDLGPAILFIGSWAMDRWGITLDELADQAMANLQRTVGRADEPQLVRDTIGGLPMTAFQSRDGWASALLLAPDLLTWIFGPEPSLYLAPMRDLVIQLPIDADPDLAAWILEEFASLDPNALQVPILALVDGELSLARTPMATVGAARTRH